MLLLHAIDCVRCLGHVPLRLLDRCRSTTFPLPSLDITLELAVLALLLFDIFAELANIRLRVGLEYELETACLSGPIFFCTLFPKVTPSPESALPTSLVEVTHWLLEED
jgi:hypothetical protein